MERQIQTNIEKDVEIRERGRTVVRVEQKKKKNERKRTKNIQNKEKRGE